MSTITTSKRSALRISSRRLVKLELQGDASADVNHASPQLTLEYSHRVSVSFQIAPTHLLSRLPKGIELESRGQLSHVDLTLTHFRRSSVFGLPLIPAFNELALSTSVRAADDVTQKGKFVFRRCVSRSLAAWHLSRNLMESRKKCEIKWRTPPAANATCPAVNFSWKAGEEDNYLNVKALSRIENVQTNLNVKWLNQHQSEFVLPNPMHTKVVKGIEMLKCLPDGNCHVYRVGHAGFKCGAKKLFGDDFMKAFKRRPHCVLFMVDGTSAYSLR